MHGKIVAQSIVFFRVNKNFKRGWAKQ